MSVEWFLKLKEIDSLSKMRINHLKVLDEQQERVTKLVDRKKVTILHTTSLGQDLRTLQQEMFELEKKLKMYSDQKTNLESLGGDEKKIEAFKNNIEDLENDGLVLMDKQDSIQKEIDDDTTFLKGLEKTILEIESEASALIAEQKTELERIELRLKMLEEELPDNFQQVFRRTLLKKLAHGPFTRIDNASCFFCRHKVSRQEESEIDMQQNLKTCHQCGRIFLPYGS